MSVRSIQFGGDFIIKREADRQDAIRVVQRALQAPVDTEDRDQFEVISREMKKGRSRAFGMWVDPDQYVDPRAAKGHYIIKVPQEADAVVMFHLNEMGILYERIKQNVVRLVPQKLLGNKPDQLAAAAFR